MDISRYSNNDCYRDPDACIINYGTSLSQKLIHIYSAIDGKLTTTLKGTLTLRVAKIDMVTVMVTVKIKATFKAKLRLTVTNTEYALNNMTNFLT